MQLFCDTDSHGRCDRLRKKRNSQKEIHSEKLSQQSSEAGIDYKNALYKEKTDENSKLWYNLIAAKKDWEKSDKADAIKKIIKAYHTDKVKKVIEESSDGMDQPVW